MKNLENLKYVGKRVPRIDARSKVTGESKYPTDIYLENMLWAKVLRSRFAHARILNLDVAKARQLPGVSVVLTYQDIPGYNGFGIVEPNWPVLCQDKVRYMGDALALIAAVDECTAKEALGLIRVDYEPLPEVDTPEQALQSGTPYVHRSGPILFSKELSKGNIEAGIKESDLILEQTYTTQFVEHAYLETEGGIAAYDEEKGVITVWCGSQWAFRDQLQIARALNWDPAKIRVIGSPTGGAFGGKDEISVQIHLALLTYYTKKPVRLHWTRDESLVVGSKRHAMKTTYRIGADKSGHLKVIDVDIIANSGPYDTISIPVINFAIQASPGPYKYPNTHFKGTLVYTNNAVGGEFRGFGNPQVVFGLEQEIDKLAEQLRVDPIEFRFQNAVDRGEVSALGHKLQDNVGIKETLLTARNHLLWKNRAKIKQELNSRFPYKKHGIGLTAIWQSIGLGPGRPDISNILVELGNDGKLIIRTGAIEIGQGNLTAYAQILAEAMGCNLGDIKIINGDTFLTPDSGSVTGSRSILMNGNALLNAVKLLIPQLIHYASVYLSIPEFNLKYEEGKVYSPTDPGKVMTLGEISKYVQAEGGIIKALGTSRMIISDTTYGHGLPSYYYNYITSIALVSVDIGTGEIELLRYVIIPDLGRAINLAGVEGQCEGGIVMGLGSTLFEEVVVKNGKFINKGFSTYIMPTSLDSPDQEAVIMENPEEKGPFGAKGIGEGPVCPVAPTIANAIYDAIGVRICQLPITPEKIYWALKQTK